MQFCGLNCAVKYIQQQAEQIAELSEENQRLKRKISDMHFEMWSLANRYSAELVITEAAPPQKGQDDENRCG